MQRMIATENFILEIISNIFCHEIDNALGLSGTAAHQNSFVRITRQALYLFSWNLIVIFSFVCS